MADHIPVTTFSAQEGMFASDLSNAGAPAIMAAILELIDMFDKTATHVGGDAGGIGALNIKDDAITDATIGDRTIDDAIATALSDTGTLNDLLSFIAKQLKALAGTSGWKVTANETVNGLDARVDTAETNISTNASNLTTHKSSTDHDSRYYTEAELDSGQLDNRYFTETEILEKVDMTNGALASINGLYNAGGNIVLEGDAAPGSEVTLAITEDPITHKVKFEVKGLALPASHKDTHMGGSDDLGSYFATVTALSALSSSVSTHISSNVLHKGSLIYLYNNAGGAL